MLTRQEAISDFDFSRGRIIPDRLTRAAHAHYLPVVEKVLTLYREGMGLTRAQLHRQAAALFDEIPDCPARRIAALVKLLDDVSEFESDRGRRAAKLRRRVFRSAACRHPLVSSAEGVFGNEQWLVKQQIAAELKMSWSEVERRLFADVMEFHPLKSFDGYANAAELLARYNVAQVQACLSRAVRMTVWANAD
jgi:predicted nuclease of restriction endonuclease-like RecB superfamily